MSVWTECGVVVGVCVLFQRGINRKRGVILAPTLVEVIKGLS